MEPAPTAVQPPVQQDISILYIAKTKMMPLSLLCVWFSQQACMLTRHFIPPCYCTIQKKIVTQPLLALFSTSVIQKVIWSEIWGMLTSCTENPFHMSESTCQYVKARQSGIVLANEKGTRSKSCNCVCFFLMLLLEIENCWQTVSVSWIYTTHRTAVPSLPTVGYTSWQ